MKKVLVLNISTDSKNTSLGFAISWLNAFAKKFDEVINFAKERLSGPKVPKSVFIRSDLPKTGSGKVLKRELKQWVQENS